MMQAAKTAASAGSTRGRRAWLTAASAMLALAAGASVCHAADAPTHPPSARATRAAFEVNDPFEKMNRRFYESHRGFDQKLIRPLALGYERFLPKALRAALHNLITQISEPAIFANYMVQLRFEMAAKTAARFATNATLGIGGLMDPAAKAGLPHHPNGFGDTMGRYGIAAGPYLYLPLVGPTDFRDMVGMGVDFAVDPLGWGHYDGDAFVRGGVWTVSGLDERARADPDLIAIEQSGTDSYANMRSYFMQNRDAEIHGNRQVRIEDLPQFEDEPAPAPPNPPLPPPATNPPPSATSAAAPASALVRAAAPTSPPARATAPSRASGDAAAFFAPARAGQGASSGPPVEL
jgi:phospholipid-binding lipoprotein MlaA